MFRYTIERETKQARVANMHSRVAPRLPELKLEKVVAHWYLKKTKYKTNNYIGTMEKEQSRKL